MTNPDSWIEAAIDDLLLTLASKNEDYKIDSEFSNFEFAASIAGLQPADVIGAQIGIKLGRLKGLSSKSFVNNESAKDTIKDLAGYAVILYAYTLATERLRNEAA